MAAGKHTQKPPVRLQRTKRKSTKGSRKSILDEMAPPELAAVLQYAFGDPYRVIAEDVSHSHTERRYYCIGKIGDGILTVRFTYRKNSIRIIGAGYWRKGKGIYEKEHQIH
jgi:hypothetical protein